MPIYLKDMREEDDKKENIDQLKPISNNNIEDKVIKMNE